MIRKQFIRIIVLLISICLSVILAEVLFRVFANVTGIYHPAARSSPAIYTESEQGFSLIPNKKAEHYSLYNDYAVLYGTNTIGLRNDSDYALDKPIDSKRIFVVGDSLAFGTGVNDQETFAAALQQVLNQNPRDPVNYEVFNLGVTGFTFDNSYVRLKKYMVYDPDLIVFIVAGVNDFIDILDHDIVYSDGDIVSVKEKARHINQYNRFTNGPRSLYSANPRMIEAIKEWMRNYSVMYAALGTLRHRNKLRAMQMADAKDNMSLQMEGLEKSEEVLDLFFNYLNVHKIKSVFILEYFQDDKLKEEFVKYLSGKTSYIIDMHDFSNQKGLYLPVDGHWSKAGGDFLAKQVFVYLMEKDLL